MAASELILNQQIMKWIWQIEEKFSTSWLLHILFIPGPESNVANSFMVLNHLSSIMHWLFRCLCFIDATRWYSFHIAGMFVWIDVKVMVICVSQEQMQTICQNTPSPGMTLHPATTVVGSERARVLPLTGSLPQCYMFSKEHLIYYGMGFQK